MECRCCCDCSGDSESGCGTTENTNSCYIGCLKGLLHTSKATTFCSQTVFQHGQYDMILDRPSIQKWWNYYYSCPRHRDSDHQQYHGVKWDTAIVMELMRLLQTLHSNNSTVGINATTKARNLCITSIFISMDIFQKKTTLQFLSPQEWSEHHRQQSNTIRASLCIMKESLPQLQSVHLYNGPINLKMFLHSLSMNVAMNDQNVSATDADDDVDRNAMIANDDHAIQPSRQEHRLYHRWNRLHIDDEAEAEEDDEDDDDENDFNFGNQVLDQERADEDDSENDDDTEFPVMINGSILASIIESSTLESITVTRCLCFYNSNDIAVLANSLQDHPRLSSVQLASMYMHPNIFMNCTSTTSTTTILQPCMDPLIAALSSLSQLESLNVTLAKESRISVSNSALRQNPAKSAPNTIISPESLQLLIAGTSIRDLTLWECLLNGSHLRAISNALLHGSSCSKSRRQTVITTTLTEPKQTSLQFLSLRCNPSITCDDWSTFYSKTLPNCFSIQSIYNDHVCGLADCDPNVPHHSTTCMGNTREGLRFWDIDMTTSTTSDETTNSESSSSTVEAAANAELFLGLNSLGRGSIIQGSYSNCTDDSANMEINRTSASENDENFLDLLSDVTDTPSALYALIRSHPIMILSFIRHQL